MAIYQLDLDLLEAARDGFQESAEKLNMDIETLYGTVAKTSEDIYSGVDADAFRNGLTDYTKTRFTELWEQTERFGKSLTDGLENGKRCKKICNDFTLTLDGTSNGKAWEDMRGMLYCDQDTIMWLQQICRLAMSEANSIRESASAIDDILSGLQMTHFDSTQYTDVIREGCKKVDRLQQHSSDLTTYASAVEASDESLRLGVDDFTFMTPEEARLLPADPQTKAITAIMNKPVSELTKEDKDIIDKNLRILTQNNEIIELETLARQMGNRPDGVWTAGDIYVAARIIDYSETKCDTMVASAVYNRMKKVTQIEAKVDTLFDPLYTIYTYEVSLDNDITGRVLKELDPVTDGLAYYSLQRRRNYTESIEKTAYGLSPKEPEIDFDISFKEADGKLISVFKTGRKTVELSSVNMNKVVGPEGKSCLRDLGFSEPEMTALMSCIYTDDDITFIGDLAKANTETDYREVFQNNPDNLSLYTKLGLYNYSLALLDKSMTYNDELEITIQDFGRLEEFINGMLYKKSDFAIAQDYDAGRTDKPYYPDRRDQYLDAMITTGQIHAGILGTQLESHYNDVEYVWANLPHFAESTQLLSLYATLATRMDECNGYGSDCYAHISNLGIYDDPSCKEPNADMNQFMFSYHESVMYDIVPLGDEKNTQVESSIINLPETNIEIKKLTGREISDRFIQEERAKRAKEAAFVIPKAVLNKCMSMIADSHPIAEKVVSTVDDAIDMAEYMGSYQDLYEIDDDISQMLWGSQIVYEVSHDHSHEDPVGVISGPYDANALLKRTNLEKKGLISFLGVDEITLKDEAIKILDEANSKTGLLNYKVRKELYNQYFILTGEAGIDEDKKTNQVQTLADLTSADAMKVINNLENDNTRAMGGLNYINYNIIDNFYRKERNKK